MRNLRLSHSPTRRLTHSRTHLFIHLVAAVSFAPCCAPAAARAAIGDELFKLTASDGATFDAFGNTNAVAVSGDVALVGARLHDAAGIGFSGAAYLYDVTSGSELSKLTPSDAEFLDLFGSAVGISGGRAVIGSFGSGDASENTGAAYLFDVSDPLNPVELHKLIPSVGEQSDGYGEAAAISGNLAIVGATGRFQNTSIGKAYMYNATTGAELAILSDNMPGTSFGGSVSISGNTAIVGAISDNAGGTFAGAAYLFDVSDPMNPVELHKLVPTDIAAFDQFGWSVSISGSTAIVGSRRDDDNGGSSGSAYLFDVATGVELAKLTASDGAGGDEFGTAVSITAGTALVGANLSDDAGGSSGSAYLYDISDPLNPLELVKLTASDAAGGDNFGRAVAIDEAVALVGANGDDSGTGAAYVFSAEPDDTTPPELIGASEFDILWPPNHKMRDIRVELQASDDQTSLAELVDTLHVTVSSNEPDSVRRGDRSGDVHGFDGFTAPVDLSHLFEANPDTGFIEGTFQLRAERLGTGDGRTYSLAATIADASGNESSLLLDFVVPHDLGGANSIPEPSAAILFGLAACALVGVLRRAKGPANTATGP